MKPNPAPDYRRAHALLRRLAVGLVLLAVSAGMFLALRAYDRHRANVVLAEIGCVDAMTDQWCIENGMTGWQVPTWDNLKPYLKPEWRLSRSGGKDTLGNPFVLGPTDEGPSINLRTVARLAWALDFAADEAHRYNFGRIHTPDIVLAARLGDAELFQELLRGGADIQGTDAEGRTALYWAAQSGHLPIVRLLWPLLPDPLAAIRQRWRGTRGLPRWVTARGFSPLHAAVYHQPEVLAFFIEHGAMLEPDQLPTAIGRPDLLKTLLEHSLSPDATTERGDPVLVLTVRNADSVRLLLAAGTDVNRRGEKGETALQKAVREGYPNAADLLRAAGARD